MSNANSAAVCAFCAAVAKPDALLADVAAASFALCAVTLAPQTITFSLPDTDGVLGGVASVRVFPDIV